jgi:hypothetical protein
MSVAVPAGPACPLQFGNPIPNAPAPYGQVLIESVVFLVATVVVYTVGRLVVVPVVLRVVSSRNHNNPTLLTATKTYLRVAIVGIAGLVGLVRAGYGNVLINTGSASPGRKCSGRSSAASFSSPTRIQRLGLGLLSQWRGHRRDRGLPRDPHPDAG